MIKPGRKQLLLRSTRFYLLLGILFIAAINACKISYSFSGASISPEVKTVNVQYFPNRSDIINPTLSQDFTDALNDIIKGQTSLVFMSGMADVNFEGAIVEYRTSPLAITGDDRAAKEYCRAG